ncbi:MAG: hypothetical protein E7466_02570 [Ruminococcaceae bacterium]|nr:hypothetical protein [Oscillospiraceae bacterium]MBQ3215933.1 hypothetical protein [Oscillospiraceae bacterium]
MFEFTIALAGRNVKITARYEVFKNYCAKYLTDGQPDFEIFVTDEDLVYEKEKSRLEDITEGKPVFNYPTCYLESLAAYRKIAEKMLDYDTILFHGSALSVDGEGFLFTAKSGTGKSTHTSFWRQQFGERVVMVNDDKPLLRITDSGVEVFGTPWDGKHRISTNTSAPLRGLCVLTRAEENYIEPISAEEAMPMLLQQSYRSASPAGIVKLMRLLDKMIKTTRLYRLGCNLNPEAALVAYEGMKRKDD